MTFNLRPSETALPRPTKGTEVPMSYAALGLRPTSPEKPTSSLWTQYIADCCAIATYDPISGERTLIHLPGGDTNAAYFQVLAGYLSTTSTIIIVAGGRWTQDALGRYLVRFKALTEAAFQARQKASDRLVWRTYSGNRLLPDADTPASFVFRPDGEYGVIDFSLPRRDDPKDCIIS
ncbi:hypothetical protein MMC21_005959 [Puttea exsequens]|nr:hypothetical protein [Puttea exsequens]